MQESINSHSLFHIIFIYVELEWKSLIHQRKTVLFFKSDDIFEKLLLQVLQDLAKRCPNLTHLLLDFSQANQLNDFSELSAFPTKLRFLTLCLSDVIFLDNFMKRIYR